MINNRNNLLAKTLLKTIKALEEDGRLSMIQSTQVFPMSTGSLSLDYFYNGGVIPAMYTISGVEQSGKTLTASTILASAYKQGVPALFYFDAESTLSQKTMKGLFDVDDMSNLITMGKSGREEFPPEVIIETGNNLEGVMDGVTRVVNNLPEKVYIDDEDQWYYKLEKDSKDFKHLEEELELNEKLTKKIGSGKYLFYKDPYSKAKSTGIQAVIVIDSLASLIPNDEDEEEDASNQLAKEAKLFSRHIKRFVGKLSKKQVLVIAINQTRENPGARFKDPEYEPGGAAIRFYSSAQIRANKIAASTAKYDSEKEQSIIDEDFEDRYSYKKFKFTKDKIGGKEKLDFILRVWMEDALHESRGIDPVVDTKEYLKMTKQWEENRGRITIPTHPIFKDKSMTWKQFKKLVLSQCINRKEYKDLLQPIHTELKLTEITDIRAWCKKQIEDRSVFTSESMVCCDLPEELEENLENSNELEDDVREI